MKRTYNPPVIPLEEIEQEHVFLWASMEERAYPELAMLYAIPNGGKRAIKTAVALKKQGVKRGVPDMCLPVARGGYHGLYVELKRQKGGTVSDEQREWIAALNTQGYKAIICHGAEEAIEQIRRYLCHTSTKT